MLRRQWQKMKPEEKAPYEEMERNYKSKQLSDMQARFPEYCRRRIHDVVFKRGWIENEVRLSTTQQRSRRWLGKSAEAPIGSTML